MKTVMIFILCCFIINGQSLIESKLDTKLIIGKDYSDQREYMFDQPSAICVDSVGNIYVSEKTELTIRKYDKQGNYIKSIGRRGRGPGEFLFITSIFINNKSELIVFDDFNQRISFFDLNGYFKKQILFSNDEILWARDIKQFKNDNYLLLFRLPNKGKRDFHIFNSDFELTQNQLPEEIFQEFDNSLVEERMPIFFPNTASILSNGKLLVAKHFYDGKIYLIEKLNNQWENTKKYLGFVENGVGYQDFSNEKKLINEKGKKIFEFHSVGPEGECKAKVYNESLSIFQLQDGRVVHFTTIVFDGYQHFGFELFDEDLELINYYSLYKQIYYIDTVTYSPYRFITKDKNDLFYVLDYSEFPVLRMFDILELIGQL